MPFAPPTNYYVRGTITKDGNPLPNATVLLYLKSNDELKHTTTSDSNGDYEFSDDSGEITDGTPCYVVAISDTGEVLAYDSICPREENSAGMPYDNISGIEIDTYCTDQIYFPSVTGFSSDAFLVAYEKHVNASNINGCSRVGRRNSNTIDFSSSTENTFHSGETEHISAHWMTTNHIIIAYSDKTTAGGGAGKLVVGVLGEDNRSFTYNSAITFDANSVSNCKLKRISSSLFALCYIDNNGNGQIKIGNLSGETITLGSANAFSSSGSVSEISVDIFNTSNGHESVVIFYTSSNIGYVTVASIDTSSSNAVTFNTAQALSSLVRPTSIKIIRYNSNDRITLVFIDTLNNDRGVIIPGAWNLGTSQFTFGEYYEVAQNLNTITILKGGYWNGVMVYSDDTNTKYLIFYISMDDGIHMNFKKPLTAHSDKYISGDICHIDPYEIAIFTGVNTTANNGKTVKIQGATIGGGGGD